MTSLIGSNSVNPFNVTEDADLGLRLVRFGYKASVIQRPTLEEAPHSLEVWIGQRTRWFKGWMQTLLVHSREPRRLVRQIGVLNSFVCIIIFLGVLTAALVHPVIYVALGLFIYDFIQNGQMSIWLLALDGFNVLAGFGAYIALGFLSCRGHPLRVPMWWPLLLPFYWTLSTIAAWRAVGQLIKRPFYWEKTPHGL